MVSSVAGGFARGWSKALPDVQWVLRSVLRETQLKPEWLRDQAQRSYSVASGEPSRTRASRPRWAGTSSKDVQRRATCQEDRTEVNEHKSVCQEQSDLAVISWYSVSLKGVRCYEITA